MIAQWTIKSTPTRGSAILISVVQSTVLLQLLCFYFMARALTSGEFLYSSPEIDAPYITEEEKERLLGLYQYLHSRAHNSSRPLKNIYYTGSKENLLAWVRITLLCSCSCCGDLAAQLLGEM